jgi:general secretion pathway protein D
VVRSKEQNDSISMDRYEYMRAAGEVAQPADDTVLLKNLGAPMLPNLTKGQPPAGGLMATMPPPAPLTARPGGATAPAQPQTRPQAPAQQAVPEFRPVQPAQPVQP